MAVAGPALDPAARPLPTPGRAAGHQGHGCCQDAYVPSSLGLLLGRRSGARALVGTALDGSALAFALRCRSWRCSCCAVRLRARNRAKSLMGATGRVVFFTLTIDPSDGRYADWVAAYQAGSERTERRLLRMRGGQFTERWLRTGYGGGQGETAPSIKYAAWAWNRLTARLRRRGWAFPYVRGVELHASGRAHLHVVARVESVTDFFALRNLLRGSWAVEAGFGPVVDIDIARSRGDVARYVAKAANARPMAPAVRSEAMAGQRAAAYIVKALDARMPRYTRRASFSLSWAPGWVKPTPIAGFSWRVAPASVEVVTRGLIASDFVMVDPERFRVRSAGGAPAEGGLWLS